MLTTFGTATYKVGLKVHPNEEDPRVPIMCWGSCAYTIQTIGNILVPYLLFIYILTYLFCYFTKWISEFKFTTLKCFCIFLSSPERILADEDKPLFGHLPCRQVRIQ